MSFTIFIVISFFVLLHRLSVKCVIKGFDNERQEMIVNTSTSECQTVHLGSFQDGTSYWTPTQGYYSLTISVHDSSPYALYSHAFSLVVTNPSSLQLQAGTLLTNEMIIDPSKLSTGIRIDYPSSLTPTSIRWIVDDKEVSSPK